MLGALQNLITELHQHVWLGGYLLALSARQADDALYRPFVGFVGFVGFTGSAGFAGFAGFAGLLGCLVCLVALVVVCSCVRVFFSCSSHVLLVFLRSLCSCARVFVYSRVLVFSCSRLRVFVCLCVLVLLCCCVLVFFFACLLAVCRLLLPLLPSALFSPLPPWLGPGIFARGGIKRLQIPSFFEDRSNKNKGVSFVFLRAKK